MMSMRNNRILHKLVQSLNIVSFINMDVKIESGQWYKVP